MRAHHQPERTLDDALQDLERLLSEGKRFDHHMAYLQRSRAALVEEYGELPSDPAHARILVDLDNRIARLRASVAAGERTAA